MISKIAVGDIDLYRIVEMEGPILGAFELFPDATRDIIDSHKHWLVPKFYEPDGDFLVIAIQGFLLKTTRQTILVDTCSGSMKNRARPIFNQKTWPWLESLSEAGTAPEDIDLVICTHLNVDHVGWNTVLRDGLWEPTFPNAQYLIAREDFQYWEQLAKQSHLPRTGDYVEDSVLPLFESGHARLMEGDLSIEDGVQIEPIPGHSPGQVAVHLSAGDEEVILASDVIHHPLQCLYPDWSTNFCVDKSLSRKTRRAFLEKYADTGIKCLPAHFPSPTAVFFERDGDRFSFRFAED